MRGAYSLVFDDARVSFLFFFISFLFVCILGWGIGYRWVRALRERFREDKTAASQAVSNAVREDVREKKACISADTG
jgi:hypothetical protein